MVLMGCRPKGRLTEQHDIFFGVAASLKELIPALKEAWPEAKGAIHIDAWRQLSQVDGYAIEVSERRSGEESDPPKLFFINLGGYKPGEFEEYHYKLVVAAADKGEAIRKAKQTAFYRHAGFKGAASHVDDKYGIDVDDAFEIKDILPNKDYCISLKPHEAPEDELHIGYFRLDKIAD